MIPDLPIFVAVGETTCCVGDMLAFVVADTMFHARKAAEKVVVDYEVLPPVTDPFEALEPDAPQVHAPGNLHVHPNLLETTAFSRGDVDAALAKAAQSSSSISDADGGTGVPRARGMPGIAARQGRQSLFAEPGIHVRPRAKSPGS